MWPKCNQVDNVPKTSLILNIKSFQKIFIMKSIQHENLFSPSTNRFINATVLFNFICQTFMWATVWWNCIQPKIALCNATKANCEIFSPANFSKRLIFGFSRKWVGFNKIGFPSQAQSSLYTYLFTKITDYCISFLK